MEPTKALKDALVSNDPVEIKNIRASQLSLLSRKLTQLKTNLVVKEGESQYDLKDVSEKEIRVMFSAARIAYNNVSELHERYVLKKIGLTETEKEDDEYMNKVDEKYFEVLRYEESYDKQLKSISRTRILSSSQSKSADTFEKLKLEFTSLQAQYKGVVELADELFKSTESDKSSTARIHKELVSDAFGKMDVVGQKLIKLIPSVSPEPTVEEKEAFACTKERLSHPRVLIKLEKLAREHEDIVRKNSSVSSDSAHNVSDDTVKYLKLKKLEAKSFSGQRREYAAWKRDFKDVVVVKGRPETEIGFTLKSCVPSKYHYLFDNLSLSEYEKMFEILDNKFGEPQFIVDETVAEIKKMRQVANDHEFVIFVDKIDKIRRDLSELKVEQEIENRTVLSELVQRLPTLVRRDWIKKVTEESFKTKSSKEVFTEFMKFLKITKKQVEYDNSESRAGSSQNKGKNFKSFTMEESSSGSGKQKGGSREPRREQELAPCIACNDGKTNLETCLHKMTECSVFQAMPLKDLLARVKCKKCPYAKDNHTFASCKKNIKCYHCKDQDHHGLLCGKRKVKSKNNTSLVKANFNFTVQDSQGTGVLPPVMCQVMFVKALSQDKRYSLSLGAVFDSYATDNYITHKHAKKLGLEGRAVALSVEGFNKNVTELDTFRYSVPVMDQLGKLHMYECYGVKEITTPEDLPDQAGYKALCEKFDVVPNKMRRPKYIDLMISMRDSADLPVKIKSIGKMTLFENCFGLTFGGWDKDLKFKPHVACYSSVVTEISEDNAVRSRAMKTLVKSATISASKAIDKQFMDFCLQDSIGVHCHPSCGGCKCGRCIPGGNQMSLKDEKAYYEFARNLEYDPIGTEADPGPYYVTKFPWIKEKTSLPNNLPAVLGVMNATKRKLKQDPEWETMYEKQLQDLIDRKVALEVTEEEMKSWVEAGNQVFYTAHQMVIQPESLSTPIRVVFNSSQVYKGHSLNGALDLGPDILNSLHAVLLRFRGDVVAAQGDISKMFYAVRVAKEDSMMQLFVWQFKGESKIRTYRMSRLVMGNIPSTNMSIVAMQVNASRGDNQQKYPNAYKALVKDSYVDNTLITAPNDEKLDEAIKETELVANSGGFFYKEWSRSKVSAQGAENVMLASSPLDPEDEKALGLRWDTTNDLLYVKVDVLKPPKKAGKKKYEVLVDYLPSPSVCIKPHLNVRIALALHMKPYDPLGLILPVRMVGNLLLRETIQTLKKELKGPVPWDEKIEGELLDRWLQYFGMLVEVNEVKFPRSYKPMNVDPLIKPISVEFADGNPNAFGAVAYVRWQLLDGSRECRIIMSKAKLAPLLHLGETYRNELCGAVFGARLKDWICENAETEWDSHKHIVDSTIVQAMVHRPSYGFNTFAGLRVGEIQQKTSPDDWLHVESKENIADCLTRGAPPSYIKAGSLWQTGPKWLLLDPSEWPVTEISARKNVEIDAEIEKFMPKTAKSNVSKSVSLAKHASVPPIFNSNNVCPPPVFNSSTLEIIPPVFNSSLSVDAPVFSPSSVGQPPVFSSPQFSKVQKVSSRTECPFLKHMEDTINIDSLCSRNSSLEKVLNVTAYLLRMVYYNTLLWPFEVNCSKKQNVYDRIPPVSASERQDAFKLLIYLAQADMKKFDRLVPKTVEVKLQNYPIKVKHIILGGRVKNFPVSFTKNNDIPIIGNDSFGRLIVQKYHDRFHRQVDTIVSHVRNDVWVVGARKIASSIDRKCI